MSYSSLGVKVYRNNSKQQKKQVLYHDTSITIVFKSQRIFTAHPLNEE